jgi:beta-glucosidase
MIPYADQVQEARGRKTADFIGINYYTKAYVQWRPLAPAHKASAQLPVGVSFAGRKDDVFSDLEWAIHPEGLTRMLAFAGGYGLPIYVTENGIADREDRLRPGFLLSHLKKVARALADGIDVRGYYYWSLLDNFEWGKGFGPRFGLYHVDYETLARKPTKSAEVYRNIIEAHRAQDDGSPRVEYFRS